MWFTSVYQDLKEANVANLDASRLVATDASKTMVSVDDLTDWVAGTTNQITVTDDTDGTITLSTPQDIHTGASPTFAGLTVVNAVDEFSTDGTLAGDSDTALPTEKAVKTYVDAQVTAQDLDFAGDSGTGSVDLDSQTFTLSGTANEIETSASSQTITIGLPNDVSISNDLTVGDDIIVTNDIDVGNDLRVGDDIIVTENVDIGGRLIVDGFAKVGGELKVEDHTYLVADKKLYFDWDGN